MRRRVGRTCDDFDTCQQGARRARAPGASTAADQRAPCRRSAVLATRIIRVPWERPVMTGLRRTHVDTPRTRTAKQGWETLLASLWSECPRPGREVPRVCHPREPVMSVGKDWLGSIGREQSSNTTCARSALRRHPSLALRTSTVADLCTTNPTAKCARSTVTHTHCHDWRSEETGSADSPTPSPPLP